MKRIISKYILLIILLIVQGFAVIAQTQRDTSLTKEVEVIKAYEPSISDAYKINDMPFIEQEEFQKPEFDYSIYSQPVYSTFSVNTLQAATMTGKPREDTGFGYLKAGAGNYSKPYVEFFFNNNESKNTIFGLHFKHLSSQGELKLKGEDKVNAPFSENYAEMFVERYFRNSKLDFNVSYTRNRFNYYGYPEFKVPDDLFDENLNNTLFNTKQIFSKGTAFLKFESIKESKSSPNSGIELNYHYFTTKSGQTEHNAKINGQITKTFNNITGFLNIGGSFYLADNIRNRTILGSNSRQQILAYARPSIYISNDWANFKAGGTLYITLDKDENTKINATPYLLLNLIPVRGILSMYGGIDGKVEQNSYSKIAYENPFSMPEHDVQNSLHQFRFFGGFDGKFSSKTNFKIGVDYTVIKDQVFYYLASYHPGEGFIRNDFRTLLDDMNKLRFYAEIIHTATDNFDLLLSGNYYVYELSNQMEAWNMPEFDAKLSLNYKVSEQLKISTDVFLLGKRKGMISFMTVSSIDNIDFDDQPFIMDTVFDLNFNADYSFTSHLSAFCQLNNFGFQTYEKWLGYPVQNFNFLAGLNYSF